MSSTLGMLLAAVGYRNGEYSRFVQESDELIGTAKQLRTELEAHKKAPDPFVNLVSSMFNNHEFEKFLERPVDIGTKAGV